MAYYGYDPSYGMYSSYPYSGGYKKKIKNMSVDYRKQKATETAQEGNQDDGQGGN